jgi:hypothetical protein
MINKRNSIQVGTRFKVQNVKTGVDPKGLAFWKVCLAMNTTINGNLSPYEYWWVKVRGKCEFAEKEWVEITEIKGIYTHLEIASNGGKMIYHTIACGVQKCEFENNQKIIQK